jgi:hypothetical protein
MLGVRYVAISINVAGIIRKNVECVQGHIITTSVDVVLTILENINIIQGYIVDINYRRYISWRRCLRLAPLAAGHVMPIRCVSSSS